MYFQEAKLHLPVSQKRHMQGCVHGAFCSLTSEYLTSSPAGGSPCPGEERTAIKLIAVTRQTKKKDLIFISYLKHRNFVSEAIKQDFAEKEKGLLLWCSRGNLGSAIVLRK